MRSIVFVLIIFIFLKKNLGYNNSLFCALPLVLTIKMAYCKFGNFREGLISRNFADAKFCENKALTKWQKRFVLY